MSVAEFTLREAQLFRMLSALFGEDRVVPHMSLAGVLGGEQLDSATREWCADQRCLITIVGHDDEPRFVLDFAAIEGDVIDPDRVELHRKGAELLARFGIHFFSMHEEDFQALITPGTGFTLVHYFDEQFARVGIDLDLLNG